MVQLSPEGKVLSCVVHDLEGSIVHNGKKTVSKPGHIAIFSSTFLKTVVSILASKQCLLSTAVIMSKFQSSMAQAHATSSIHGERHEVSFGTEIVMLCRAS